MPLGTSLVHTIQRNVIQHLLDLVSLLKESRQLRLRHGFGWLEYLSLVVNLLSVFPKSETYVWACSQTCRSNISNRLPLSHPGASTNTTGIALHVQVLGLINFIVSDFDISTVVTGISSVFNNSISNSSDRSAVGRGVICAQVRNGLSSDRVESS